MRIVVLGGGFGGVATVRHLERVLGRGADVEITLVSRENFFVITPLLFEACSGRLELRHCAQPIRAALRRARFIEATVESVDLERQLVRAVAPSGDAYVLPYDHLVVALGASTNDGLIPGSSNALTFKTMAEKLPAGSNAVIAINVAKVLDTPFAKAEWTPNTPEASTADFAVSSGTTYSFTMRRRRKPKSCIARATAPILLGLRARTSTTASASPACRRLFVTQAAGLRPELVTAFQGGVYPIGLESVEAAVGVSRSTRLR